MSQLKFLVRQHLADAALLFIMIIWGLHFIVMKDGVMRMDALTYNALRFTVGLPLMLGIGARMGVLRLSWRDLAEVMAVTLFGSVLYQVLFLYGLERTPSTNSALLVATMPTWTALISLALGLIALRPRLLIGIALTLGGSVLVILSRSDGGVSLEPRALHGSLVLLVSAVVSAAATLVTKPVVDRLGSLKFAIWSYLITALGVQIIAAPALLHLSARDIPARVWPNVLYSGWLASVGGFLIWNYGLRAIGPTRSAAYHNLIPIIAAVGGIALLGDALTAGLAVGGPLTLIGVVLVRQNTFLRARPAASRPAVQDQPAHDQRDQGVALGGE